jgi:antitoxin PrlF
MTRATHTAKLSAKAQTVIPRAIREKLGLKPGDSVRFVETKDGILIGKAVDEDSDPFAVFGEWRSDEDDKAYRDL